MPRLFIALWPGPRVRQALAETLAGRSWAAGGHPVAIEKLHLTLHFLGQVPDGRVPDIAAALARPVHAFELRLDLAQTWRGGLAVLSPRKVPQRLRQLHAELASTLERLGLRVEAREFRPHVTLARHSRPSESFALVPVLRWRVSGFALVQSTTDGRYEVLRRYR